MRKETRISVIIPAFNEEKAISKVLQDIPEWVDEVIVANNGSTDSTAKVSKENGARVVDEPRSGYGSACLAAIGALSPTDIVVFIDGDYSDRPQEMHFLVDPILAKEVDLVIGSRTLGQREPGALAPVARFGNWLSCHLIHFFWRVRFTDLGPFRAITRKALKQLEMRDPDYGWTVEMQIKAVCLKLRVKEVPVTYHKRIGKSKISGTLRGIIGAGTKILGTIFISALRTSLKRKLLYESQPDPVHTIPDGRKG